LRHQMEEMSHEKQGRVQVDDLPQPQKELKSDEAKDVKGGGSKAGGGGDITRKNSDFSISR
jgi:hypothetical protein